MVKKIHILSVLPTHRFTWQLQFEDLSIIDHLLVRFVSGREEPGVLIKRLRHQFTETLE